MKKQLAIEVINLLKSICDDAEYTNAIKHLQNNDLNKLRLFATEKYELLSALLYLDSNNQVLRTQVTQCNVLEDMIISAYEVPS